MVPVSMLVVDHVSPDWGGIAAMGTDRTKARSMLRKMRMSMRSVRRKTDKICDS